SRPGEVEIADPPAWLIATGARLSRPREAATGPAAESLLARAMAQAGYAVRRVDDLRVAVDCPWADEHTARSGSSGTVVFAPRPGEPRGYFYCSHAHCANRRTR